MTTPKPKRGGARLGAGRKPKPDHERLERLSIRVPPIVRQAHKLDPTEARDVLTMWARRKLATRRIEGGRSQGD